MSDPKDRFAQLETYGGFEQWTAENSCSLDDIRAMKRDIWDAFDARKLASVEDDDER